MPLCPTCKKERESLGLHYAKSPECDPAKQRRKVPAEPIARPSQDKVSMHQLCGQVKRDITHLHLKSLIKTAQIDMMLNMVTGWLQLILNGITEDVCRDLPSALPFMQVAIDRVQKTWKQCNACDKMIADAVSSGKIPYVEPRVIQKIPGQVASKKNAVALSARELISRIMNTSQKRCDTMWESSEVCKCHGMHAGCARALMRAL